MNSLLKKGSSFRLLTRCFPPSSGKHQYIFLNSMVINRHKKAKVSGVDTPDLRLLNEDLSPTLSGLQACLFFDFPFHEEAIGIWQAVGKAAVAPTGIAGTNGMGLPVVPCQIRADQYRGL